MNRPASPLSCWALGLLLLSGACTQTSGKAQDEDGGGPAMSQSQAVQAAMSALTQLVTTANYASVGFASAAEAKQARAGEPTVQRILAYDRLLAWKPGFSIDSLLEPQELALYPVNVGETTKTSFLLRRGTTGWSIVTIGDRAEAATLQRAKELRTSQAQVIVLAVPGLNLEFLQVVRAGQISLVATRDFPELEWKAGDSRSIDDGLKVLAGYATGYEAQHAQELREHRLVK